MNFKLLFIGLSLTFLAAVTSSCSGDFNNIGGSLINDEHEVYIDSTFVITGRSVENNRIQSRTVTQLLGSISAEGYGFFSSEYVTQFMCANVMDTVGVSVDDVDSLVLVINVPKNDIIGDSLIPMGLEIYPLTKQLPTPIYSDFDPEGYYDPNTKLTSAMYKCNVVGENDTIKTYENRYIYAKMPTEIGKKLFASYRENPGIFSDPESFTDLFPGVFIRNSYGSGRVMRVQQTSMRLHYKKHSVNDNGNDTTIAYVGYYFASKPEVVTNNLINYSMSSELQQRLQDGENIVVAPAGRDVEITFPAPEIIDTYSKNAGKVAVLNTLTFKIPVNEIENDYDIAPPQNVMMILSKDKDNFFVENKVTDDVTSFVAEYNATSGCYEFSGMRSYMLDLLSKDEVKEEDYTFVITPVSLVTTEEASTYYYYYYTQTNVSAIVPYTSTPAMASLDLKNSKITLTFSKQVVNN